MPKSVIEHVREQRSALAATAQTIIDTAEAEERSLTAEEFAQVRAVTDSPELVELDERLTTLTSFKTRTAAATAELPTARGGARVNFLVLDFCSLISVQYQ